MSNVSLFIPLVAVVVLLFVAQRGRRRAAERDAELLRSLTVGSRVMTTSGLYATVVALDDDETAQLEIAPGVVATWARAAIRPVTSLPEKYRPESADSHDPAATAPSEAVDPAAPRD